MLPASSLPLSLPPPSSLYSSSSLSLGCCGCDYHRGSHNDVGALKTESSFVTNVNQFQISYVPFTILIRMKAFFYVCVCVGEHACVNKCALLAWP